MFVKGMISNKLESIIENDLPNWLRSPELWNSLDIRHQKPHVKRLWRQIDDNYKLCLHVISPSEESFWHPHPWPSAVKIIKGEYIMEVGHGVDGKYQSIDATIKLAEGSVYEMINPYGWHSVRPVSKSALSVTLSGPPYHNQIYDKEEFGANHHMNKEIHHDIVVLILKEFAIKLGAIDIVA